jgi:hypothetical protein
MKTIKMTLLVLLGSLLSAGTVFAQTNFSGNWQIDTIKTDFGGAPHWVLPVSVKVVQKGENVSITRSSADAQGTSSVSTENLSDGDTSATITGSGLKRKAILHWDNYKKTFTIHSATKHADDTPNAKINETWSVLEDDKTLVIDRNVEQADGLNYSIKAYYNKD